MKLVDALALFCSEVIWDGGKIQFQAYWWIIIDSGIQSKDIFVVILDQAKKKVVRSINTNALAHVKILQMC